MTTPYNSFSVCSFSVCFAFAFATTALTCMDDSLLGKSTLSPHIDLPMVSTNVDISPEQAWGLTTKTLAATTLMEQRAQQILTKVGEIESENPSHTLADTDAESEDPDSPKNRAQRAKKAAIQTLHTIQALNELNIHFTVVANPSFTDINPQVYKAASETIQQKTTTLYKTCLNATEILNNISLKTKDLVHNKKISDIAMALKTAQKIAQNASTFSKKAFESHLPKIHVILNQGFDLPEGVERKNVITQFEILGLLFVATIQSLSAQMVALAHFARALELDAVRDLDKARIDLNKLFDERDEAILAVVHGTLDKMTFAQREEATRLDVASRFSFDYESFWNKKIQNADDTSKKVFAQLMQTKTTCEEILRNRPCLDLANHPWTAKDALNGMRMHIQLIHNNTKMRLLNLSNSINQTENRIETIAPTTPEDIESQTPDHKKFCRESIIKTRELFEKCRRYHACITTEFIKADAYFRSFTKRESLEVAEICLPLHAIDNALREMLSNEKAALHILAWIEASLGAYQAKKLYQRSEELLPPTQPSAENERLAACYDTYCTELINSYPGLSFT